MAGDFNIQFFENNAVPQYAILVKGGELAKGTRKRIEEYFREHIKGQAHKTLILEVVGEEGEEVDVEIKPLANGEAARVHRPGRVRLLRAQAGPGIPLR
jgi:capsid portal protein